MRHGYAVIDGALDATRIAGGAGGEWDPTLSETLFRELDDLAGTPGVMVPNATHLVRKEGTVKLEKANILEAEVHALGDDILTNKAPTFRAILEDRRCGNTNATHACGGCLGRRAGEVFFFRNIYNSSPFCFFVHVDVSYAYLKEHIITLFSQGTSCGP